MSIGNCQACGEPIDGPPTYPIPGIAIAILCVQCRQDFQRVIMVEYGKITARFDESVATMNRLRSGFPTSSGLSGNSDAYKDHVDLEASMIAIWDGFLKSKTKEQDEQGETSPSNDSD